jgi:hypothetical protein
MVAVTSMLQSLNQLTVWSPVIARSYISSRLNCVTSGALFSYSSDAVYMQTLRCVVHI